jgi:Ribonuclease G/E
MENIGDNIRRSLLKRQEALNRFTVRKEAFGRNREQAIKDIEEARNTWKNTLEQLPKQEFN